MRHISDLTHDTRWKYRHAIEDARGKVAAYIGDCFQAAAPRDYMPWCENVAKSGLVLVCSHFFPIGSDDAPEDLRHDGIYPGSRGFWRYVSLRPPELCSKVRGNSYAGDTEDPTHGG